MTHGDKTVNSLYAQNVFFPIGEFCLWAKRCGKFFDQPLNSNFFLAHEADSD